MNTKPFPSGPKPTTISRRDFVKTTAAGAVATAALAPFASVSARGAAIDEASKSLQVPLADATHLTIEGPHRFRSIAGRIGFHPTSLKTQAVVKTDLHRSPQGTMAFWFSPLEDLTFCPGNQSSSKVPFEFPFVSDAFPGRDLNLVRFGVSFSSGYPAIVGRFATGGVFAKLDFGLAPFVYAEKVLLRQGFWYYLALTWDRKARSLVIYLNGMMAGHNPQADNFEEAAPQLFLGNPMMVLRELHLENRVLSGDEIRASYRRERLPDNDLPDSEFRKMLTPAFQAPLDLKRDAEWKSAYECSFSHPKDLEGWTRQGPGETFMNQFRMESTAEGLYIKTPDQIEKETRMYLWSQKRFEGDQWVEFDFRLESPKGLALVSLCTSGMQREDFFEDHGVPNTGSMVTILRDLRNYHWEYMRRVEAMRTDVETQYVAKNPFGHRLHCGCVPRLEQNHWYRLRFIKAGPRLHGSFDGQTVFDLTDDPFRNNGPVYNFGRIGLRQMYHTAMRYRNLVVYQRAAES